MESNEEGFEKAELILRYMRNELNEAQEKEFLSWLDENPENKELLNKLRQEHGLQEEYAFFASTGREAAWEDLKLKLQQERPVVPLRRRVLKYVVAASILLFSTFGLFYFLKHEKKQEQIAVQKQTIKPGGNRALLTLSDGRQISLDDAANGELAQLDNITILKTEGGQIVYQVKNTDSSSPLTYNTISTPRGGQYKVILPDGSAIWLNALSSLRYPTSFTNQEHRKVELTGEAYFEVAKDKTRPFVVSCNNQTVHVLGTHFNINGYTDEGVTRTTLTEGAVRVTSGQGSVNIKPGEQALLGADQKLTVSVGDTEEAVAWVNGNFVFNSRDLGTIMRSVSRWYGTDIQYVDNISSRKFTGSISRYESVYEVLEMLELTGLVHFKVEGRRVLVME